MRSISEQEVNEMTVRELLQLVEENETVLIDQGNGRPLLTLNSHPSREALIQSLGPTSHPSREAIIQKLMPASHPSRE